MSTDKKRQIICISTSNYEPVPTRKQNVMNRLKHSDILYLDPPVTYLAPIKDRITLSRLNEYKKPGKKVKDNLTVYASPPVFPFFNKYRWINRLNQRRLAGYIKKLMKLHSFNKPVLWCYSPTSCDIIEHIPNSGVVYDCVDRHSAYPGMINPAVVDAMERDLALQATQVFCTAQGLYDTLIKINKNTEFIPNGAAYELFSKAAGSNQKKDEKPVFGFVGMLQECIDYRCIKALAEAYPQGKIVMIGRRLPGVDLSILEKYNNIEFRGLIPQDQLPEHIKEFDVCLNIFREGKLSKDVSPLKFYEYLATGKPIVSTKVPLQVTQYSDVVYIADTVIDFVIQCGRALSEKDKDKSLKRQQYGKASSWDERVRQMEEILLTRGL